MKLLKLGVLQNIKETPEYVLIHSQEIIHREIHFKGHPLQMLLVEEACKRNYLLIRDDSKCHC
jgi:hypothetical protein